MIMITALLPKVDVSKTQPELQPIVPLSHSLNLQHNTFTFHLRTLTFDNIQMFRCSTCWDFILWISVTLSIGPACPQFRPKESSSSAPPCLWRGRSSWPAPLASGNDGRIWHRGTPCSSDQQVNISTFSLWNTTLTIQDSRFKEVKIFLTGLKSFLCNLSKVEETYQDCFCIALNIVGRKRRKYASFWYLPKSPRSSRISSNFTFLVSSPSNIAFSSPSISSLGTSSSSWVISTAKLFDSQMQMTKTIMQSSGHRLFKSTHHLFLCCSSLHAFSLDFHSSNLFQCSVAMSRVHRSSSAETQTEESMVQNWKERGRNVAVVGEQVPHLHQSACPKHSGRSLNSL